MNNRKVCVSLCAKTAAELFKKIARADRAASVIELRFDCLDPSEVDAALENLPETSKQYLITYRPSEQGGMRVLPLNTRILFWKKAIARLRGTNALVDHEADIDFPFGFVASRRINSVHFFSDPPPDLRPVFFELADSTEGPIKIAAAARDVTEAISVWKLLDVAAREECGVIPIAMGEAGKWTRILGPAHGAFMTYAALDEAEATAPGQITVADLIDVFRVNELDRQTRVHGIVAGNTSYSISPWMHNAGFKTVGENRVFVPLQVGDVDVFIRRMVRSETREIDLNFAGFSVTNPHKKSIIPHLDEVQGTAERIGAVNTVKIEKERLYGYNTDAQGFIKPLTKLVGDLKDAKVAVVGAGGAARACVYSLTEAGARVSICARNISKVNELAETFGAQMGPLPASFLGFDIVVNCTPLGTKGDSEDQTIATADQLNGVKLVYDLVYNPTETRLVLEAQAAGIQTLGGLEMLIAQGAEQFEIWTGRPAPVEAMTAAVRKKLKL